MFPRNIMVRVFCLRFFNLRKLVFQPKGFIIPSVNSLLMPNLIQRGRANSEALIPLIEL